MENPSQNHAQNHRPLRISVVDDETLVLEGLAALLRKTPGFDVVTATTDARSALDGTTAHRPDVALVDVGSPVGNPWAGAALWQAEAPAVRLLLLDDLVRDVHLRRVLKLGVHGYAVKRDSFAEIAELLRAVARGEQVFSRSARERLTATPYGWQPAARDDRPGLHLLTVRELEVLTHVVQGQSVRAVAAVLKISPSTVENHKARIMKKLDIHRMVDLARFAMREGILPP